MISKRALQAWNPIFWLKQHFSVSQQGIQDALGIFGVFLLSRLIVLAGFWAAGHPAWVNTVLCGYRFLFNSPSPSGSPFAIHPFSLEPTSRTFTDFAKMWDGFWYLDISQYGYAYDGTTQHQSITFYPLYPWLSKGFSVLLTGLGLQSEQAILLSGLILSNLLFLIAIWMLFSLVRQKSGRPTAWVSILLLSLYPGSLFCSLFLTESLFLALAISFFLALERRHYLLAVLLSWPACLTRFNGVSLAMSMIAHLWGQVLKTPYKWLALAALTGVFLYPLYLWWGLGDPWLYLKMHANYRGQLPIAKLSGLLLVFAIAWILGGKKDNTSAEWKSLHKIREAAPGFLCLSCAAFYVLSFINLLGWPGPWQRAQHVLPIHLGPVLAATAFGLIVFGWYRHKLEPAYKTYVALNLFPLLFAGTFFSNHRYLILIFPIFWALAGGLERSIISAALCCTLFALLLFGLTVLYAAMGWLMIF